MKEVFQNYKHYCDWISENYQITKELDDLIISLGLLIEKEVNCNGETHRNLTKLEFTQKESQGFVFVPLLNNPELLK